MVKRTKQDLRTKEAKDTAGETSRKLDAAKLTKSGSLG